MLILFWACVLCSLHAPHTLLMHHIIIIIIFLSFFLLSFLLLFFYFFVILLFLLLSFFVIYLFIIIFILKRENENILNYKKLKKIEKNLKTKNVLFCFVVSVRLPASCDTHF